MPLQVTQRSYRSLTAVSLKDVARRWKLEIHFGIGVEIHERSVEGLAEFALNCDAQKRRFFTSPGGRGRRTLARRVAEDSAAQLFY